MKKLFSHPNLAFIQHLKLLLESRGIACGLKNEFLQAGVGEIPPQEVWPELWIHNEKLFEQASALLDEAVKQDASELEKWECGECGELLEAQFTECWQCGASRS